MSEIYQGIPENLKMGRVEGKPTAEAPASMEQTPRKLPTLEDNRDYVQKLRSHTRPSDSAMLAEIRDQLRKEEMRRKMDDVSAVMAQVNEAVNRNRAETQVEAQQGDEKVTVGKLVLSILGAIASAPVTAAEQTLEDTQELAKHAK